MVSYWSFIGQRAQQRLIDRANGAKVKRNITAEKDFELCSYYQKGFDTWICDIYYQRPNAFDLDDAHHQRQTPQMYWTQGVDLIIRVEDFDRDFLKIQSLVGCYQPLQKRNTSDHGHYRQYYQSNTQQMVAEMFNQDIKKFDYEF